MFEPTVSRRRMVVATDMEKYSRRDNVEQVEAQEVLVRATEAAAADAGLDRSDWGVQSTGDGQIFVLPADVREEVIVGRFVAAADRLLRGHNRSRLEDSRVRLRIAVHVGQVHLVSANSWAGDAIVTACRLLNAVQLRRALTRHQQAAVVSIVSDPVYQEVVRHRYDGISPEHYGQVRVQLTDKGFDQVAWIHVPGLDVSDLADTPPDDDGNPRQPGTSRPADPGSLVGTVNADTVSVGPYSQAHGHYGQPRPRPGDRA
jgi:hypothetical protein